MTNQSSTIKITTDEMRAVLETMTAKQRAQYRFNWKARVRFYFGAGDYSDLRQCIREQRAYEIGSFKGWQDAQARKTPEFHNAMADLLSR